MSLPIFISLKSDDGRYLRHMRDHGGDVRLQFSENIVGRPWNKFELKIAETEEQHFHIKSCYNNRFWARIADSDLVAAVADEPEEGTLFKLVPGVDSRVGFEHIQSQSRLSKADSSFNDCLLVSGKNDDSKTSFTVIDWDSLVFLPRYVAFKDDQGKYLCSCLIGQQKYLQFSSDVTDQTTANEIIPAGDGTVRIKQGDEFWTTFVKKGRLLSNRPNWILLNGKASDNQAFWPESVDGSTIILRNVDNLPCKKAKKDCLAIGAAGHLPMHIQVEEYVKERRINNVRYHFPDARIYSDHTTETVVRYASNNTATRSFRLQKKTRTVSCWKSSVSRKLVSKVSISAKIPVFSERLEASDEYRNDAYRWGEIIEFLNVVDTAAEITVPGKVAMWATEKRVLFEVPFSYTQSDTLLNDEVKVEDMEDGVYSGAYTKYSNYEKETRLHGAIGFVGRAKKKTSFDDVLGLLLNALSSQKL